MLISRRAVREWFSRPEISLFYPASWIKIRGAGRLSRILSRSTFIRQDRFSLSCLRSSPDKNPTEREVADLLFQFNKICYVWHEENEALDNAGFKSAMPEYAAETDMFSGPYVKVGIEPVQTSFRNGPPLFRELNKWRQAGVIGMEHLAVKLQRLAVKLQR